MDYRFKEAQLSLEHSDEFDKEDMLNTIIETSGLTPTQFEAIFVIEEHPLEILRVDDRFAHESTIVVRQEFKIRRRMLDDQTIQLSLEEGHVNRTDAKSFA